MKYSFDMPSLETQEMKFQSLVRETSIDEHAQCIRILSMHLAMYKNCFGDINSKVYENFMVMEGFDNNPDKFFEIGLHEAINTMNKITRSRN